MDHFERIELNDLTNSIILHRKTLTLCPSDHSDRHVSLDNLANSLWIRFERLGQLEDLEEAITLCRETVSLSSLGHPDHSSLLAKLADRVLNRYEQLGLAEDLEEAIALHSEALALNSLGHPHRSRSLTNLANCIRTRFYQLGRPEDLEDAIAFNREALSLRPSGHPDRSVTLSSLGNSIIARFEYLHQPQDFEEGISLHREALALCPSGHPNRFVALKDLANGLLSCCNDLENLEEMIMLRREALSLCPPGRPGHIDCLRLLAKSVIIRGQHLSRAEDLEEAVSYGLRAVENARVTGHPLLTDILGDLGNAYILLKDFDRGFQFFEDAINHIHSSSVDRFKTALAWSTIARRHHHPSTLKAYVSALELSERHLAVLPSVQLQSMFLAEDVRRLPSDAASYAIQEGHLETAVEMLEQGRAQLWSKMRGYRHTLGNLRETNPELAARFERVSFELESLATSVIIVETSQAAEASEVSRRLSRQRDLSDQWNSILRDIREVPGRSAFFTTPPYSDLRIAAAEGPVIMVNVTAHRSDALIIRANDTPTLVPLDENLSPTTIFILSSRLSNINSNRKMVLGGKSRHRTDAADKMPSILQTLWRDICGPVAAKLKGMGIPANSRIWWCPTGDLCHLPLHAAGPHSTNEKNFSDLFVSSYTPTLSSLINARHTMQSEPGSKPRLLAIGQSQFLPQVCATIFVPIEYSA